MRLHSFFRKHYVTLIRLMLVATSLIGMPQADKFMPVAPLHAADQTADLIYYNGVILTMDDANPKVEAVAVKDGIILFASSKAKVLKTKSQKTRVINLNGRTMLPGFVDAHGHVMGGGLQALSANLLPPPDGQVKDILTLQQTLREWMQANKKAVSNIKLIVGFGYDNAQLKELRHPNRDDLDAVSKEIPIVLIHQSGHIITVNSLGLDVGEIKPDTKDPQGGVIQRKEDGKTPNGVLEETAAFPVLLKLLARVGAEGSSTFLKAGADLWARYGYTTAQDGRTMPAAIETLKNVAASGELKIDIVSYPDILVARDQIKKEVSSTYNKRFRVAGAKLTIDGSPQGFTAWRDRPYYKPVGQYPPGYVGYPAANAKQVKEAVNWTFENKIQLITHANGEAASDQLIAYLKAATHKYGADDRRPVLIHGQFLREDQVDAYIELKVIPSLFPMHTFYWGDWHREHTVGPKRADHISPTGWFHKRGVRFTTHHDAPVAFPNSMRVLDATVTRRSRSGDIIGPEHRIDVMTTLKAMTLWSAWQHFEEKRKGSIEKGKLADLVILDKDPTAVDPETLDQIKVMETIKEGNTVFKLQTKKETANAKSFKSYLKRAGTNELAFNRSMKKLASFIHHEQAHKGKPTNHHYSQHQGCLCETMSKISEIMARGKLSDY